MLVVSDMRQRPVHESSKLSLMAGPGLGECLLKLAARRGQSDAHRIGRSLEAVTVRNNYRRLSFTIGEVKSSP
jgi:hypothetical protein